MKRDFSILKEVISPKNVEVMSELIAIQETKFLISLIGGSIRTWIKSLKALSLMKPTNWR